MALGAAAGLVAAPVPAQFGAGSAPRGRGDPASGASDASLQAALANFASPERYGASGDGVTDDTAAMQAALDSGHSIRLTQGRTYLIRSKLVLSTSGVTLTGGGRLEIARDFRISSDINANGTHMRVLFITGANVTINGVVFDASNAPMGSAVENGFLWTTAAFTAIRDCQFIGLRKGTSIWALGNAPYLSVSGCQFLDCSGAVFAKGRNTIVSNNTIINATDAAIAINGKSSIGAVVANNTISNERLAVIPSMIAVEEAASDWTITGNTLVGVNGGGIVCTNVMDSSVAQGGVVANNVITAYRFDGTLPRSSSPAAMLSISGSYRNWIAHDNRISGCPAGNSNSRLAMIAATGGIFHDNIIDGTVTPGLSALVGISAGQGGLTIKDNRTTAPNGGRHYLFGAESYGNMACTFIGGKFYGGAEGINCELNAQKMRDFLINIENVADVTARNFINAPTMLGDRAAFLNAGAWTRPHRIGAFTEMHCSTIPTLAGAIPFQTGDKLYFMNPTPFGCVGVVRSAGAWRKFGQLV